MKFLEKDLETIIWENTEACYERGLTIRRIGGFVGDCRFRQLHLGPYGIADLVNTRYYPGSGSLWIQVIECKKDEVNLSTYAQAKRYLTAIKAAVCHHYGIAEKDCYTQHELVLVGRKFENSGDFPFVYNDDLSCVAYTYDYDIDGLRFSLVPRGWGKNLTDSDGALATFTTAFSEEMANTANYEASEQEQMTADILAYGDTAQALLVTSDGIIVNQALLDRHNQRGY